MDLFKGIGDFFNSVFNQDEKKKKPKEEQPKQPARAVSDMFKTPTAKQTPQTARPDTLNVKAVSSPVAKPTQTKAPITISQDNLKVAIPVAKKQSAEFAGLTPEDTKIAESLKSRGKRYSEFVELARKNKKEVEKANYENSVPGKILNTGGEVLKTLTGTAVDIGSRVVETADQAKTAVDRFSDSINPTMSKEEKAARILLDSKRFKSYKDFRSGVDDFFFSGSKNEKGETNSEETDREAANISRGKAEAGEVFSAAMKSLDLAGFVPLGTLVSAGTKASREAMAKSAERVTAELEKRLGRKLDADEIATVEKEVKLYNPSNEPATTAPTTTKIVEEQVTPEQKTVGESYAKVFNQVSNDQNLTPQQKVEFLSEAKARHTKMLDDIKTSQVEEAKAIDTAIKTSQEEQLAREADIAKVQQAQQEQVTPPVDEVVTAPTKEPLPQEMEKYANNVYDDFKAIDDEVAAAKPKESEEVTSVDFPDIVATHRARFGDENIKLFNPDEKPGKLGTYNYHDDMVAIADGLADTEHTVNHEHVHKAIGQFLSDADIENLYRDIVKIRGGKSALTKKYQDMGYDKATWRVAAEEEIANEFNTFIKYRMTLKTSDNIADKLADFAIARGLPQSIIQLFMKLSDNINATFGRDKAAGRVDDFYKRILNEEFANPDIARREAKYKAPNIRRDIADFMLNSANSGLARKVLPVPVQQKLFDRAFDFRHGDSATSQTKDALAPIADDTYNDTENLIKANEDFRNAQKKTFKDGFDTLRRELYDPQLLTQKVDNETMARLKENNLLKPGQTRLLPSQSVTFQNSLIYNATQATQAKASENGLAQIISKHANADDLNEFAFYRMYKDELWRINNGANNTLPVDPEEMARYVRKYDTERPDWAEDNAMLREIALDNFRARVDAGIDSAEMLRNAEVNPFYSPRRQVEIEDAAKPGVTGSFNRTAKTTKSRQEGVLGTVEAPIDLYMLDTQDTIRGLAVQQRAKLLREAGYEVTQSAEEAARRRDITKEMAILSDAVDQMRTLRNATRKDIKKTKAYSKGEEAKAKAQEDKAINALRKMIEQAKNDPGSIWRDLAVRDPRYAPELDAIKKQELPNLSPIERKEQIKFDIQQLNAKYPDPVALKDDELRSIVNQLGEANAFTGDALGASRAASGRAEEANTMVEQLTGLLHQSRQEIADYKQASSDLFEELKEYPINPKTGAAEVTYKVDGAAGKIAIPPQLAREWAALDALYKHSPVGVTLNTIGSLQKATWTGMLSPVFQVLQPLRNLGQMFVNAEGLSAFNPQAVRQFLGSMFSINGGKFREAAQQAGAQYETATRGIMMRRSITDDIINTANIKNFLVRNPFNTLSDVGRGINRAFAHVSNAQRDAVIAGAVARAKNMGMNDADALAYGTEAAVKVFGDFNRVSQVVRALDSTLLPYAGATQAGVRADVRAIKERPAETLAKYGLMLGSMAGIVGWNLQQGMKEYYDDMDAQGRQDDYENNVVIAIGPVSKNADGEWQNIVKAPLTPDFRPLYRETVDTVRTVADGGEFDPVGLGANIFNFFTGDIGSSVYNEKRTDEGKNPLGGFVTSSPIVNIGRILSGQNLFDGGQTVDDYTYNKEDRGKQVWDNTSGAGKTLSDLTGNAITPIQVDQILGMFGNAGKSVKEATDGKEGGGLGIFDFTKPFKVANSKTKKEMKGIQYGRDIDDAKAYVAKNYDEKTFKDFVALHAKSTEEQKKSMLTNAIKASQFMNYTGDGTFSTTPLFQAEEYLDKLRRDRGEPGNPIYDLGPQELQAVLTYRSMKIPNAAKQNFTKDGEGAFQSLGLDNKWYSDFQAAESAYWDSVFEGETKDNEYKTFSGETKPKLNPEQAALEQQYYSLPEKSPERRAFLDANPWLKDHWAAGNEFTDEERKALGFKPLEADSSSGGGGGNYSPYGAVGTLLNIGKTERLEAADSKEVKANPNFQSLFATRRGGRANAKLGAESKG